MSEVKCPLQSFPVKNLDPEIYGFPSLNEAVVSSGNNEQQQTTSDFQEVECSRPGISNRRPEKMCDVIGLVFCLIAIILDLAVSFCWRNWFKRKESLSDIIDLNRTVTVGLWSACIEMKSAEFEDLNEINCWNHNEKEFPFSFKFVGATQALQCLGVILLCFSVLAMITKVVRLRENDALKYFAGFHAIWAAVCFATSAGLVRPGLKNIQRWDILTEEFVYVDYSKDVEWGCDLSYLSAFIAVIGGAILLLNKRVTYFLEGRRLNRRK